MSTGTAACSGDSISFGVSAPTRCAQIPGSPTLLDSLLRSPPVYESDESRHRSFQSFKANEGKRGGGKKTNLPVHVVSLCHRQGQHGHRQSDDKAPHDPLFVSVAFQMKVEREEIVHVKTLKTFPQSLQKRTCATCSCQIQATGSVHWRHRILS